MELQKRGNPVSYDINVPSCDFWDIRLFIYGNGKPMKASRTQYLYEIVDTLVHFEDNLINF